MERRQGSTGTAVAVLLLWTGLAAGCGSSGNSFEVMRSDAGALDGQNDGQNGGQSGGQGGGAGSSGGTGGTGAEVDDNGILASPIVATVRNPASDFSDLIWDSAVTGDDWVYVLDQNPDSAQYTIKRFATASPGLTPELFLTAADFPMMGFPAGLATDVGGDLYLQAYDAIYLAQADGTLETVLRPASTPGLSDLALTGFGGFDVVDRDRMLVMETGGARWISVDGNGAKVVIQDDDLSCLEHRAAVLQSSGAFLTLSETCKGQTSVLHLGNVDTDGTRQLHPLPADPTAPPTYLCAGRAPQGGFYVVGLAGYQGAAQLLHIAEDATDDQGITALKTTPSLSLEKFVSIQYCHFSTHPSGELYLSYGTKFLKLVVGVDIQMPG